MKKKPRNTEHATIIKNDPRRIAIKVIDKKEIKEEDLIKEALKDLEIEST